MILACNDLYYILRYSRELVSNAIVAGNINPEEGVEGSFELENTVNERVRTGQWVGDCFLYTNGSGENFFIFLFCFLSSCIIVDFIILC